MKKRSLFHLERNHRCSEIKYISGSEMIGVLLQQLLKNVM